MADNAAVAAPNPIVFFDLTLGGELDLLSSHFFTLCTNMILL